MSFANRAVSFFHKVVFGGSPRLYGRFSSGSGAGEEIQIGDGLEIENGTLKTTTVELGDIGTDGFTIGNILRVNSDGSVEGRTPSQTRSDIGAAPASGIAQSAVTNLITDLSALASAISSRVEIGGITAGTSISISGSGLSADPYVITLGSHTHSASQISDSTEAGRALVTAADAAAQRTALDCAKNPESAEESVFYDDFDRADTADNAIGNAPSGQEWVITGSGAADVRIKNRTLTHVSPWTGAFYAWPSLAFSPRRVGCLFRVDQEAGVDNAYALAMAMASGVRSLTGTMLHFTFNHANLSVEVWVGGSPVVPSTLQTMTFAQPLQMGQVYPVEWEIDPDNDRMTIYGPSGEILEFADSRVSDAFGPSIFFETGNGGSDTGRVASFLSCWATGTASQRTHFEGRIAADLARFGRPIQNVAFSIGPDSDKNFVMGRCRVGSINSDVATFGHYDHSAIYKNAVSQDSFGQTVIGSGGASFPIFLKPNASDCIIVYPTRMEFRQGVSLTFNPANHATNKMSVTSDSLTAARTVGFPDVSGKVALVPAYADDTAAGSGGLASKDLYWNTTSKKLVQIP